MKYVTTVAQMMTENRNNTIPRNDYITQSGMILLKDSL